MAFDELLANNTNDDIKQSALLAQALKRQEYNRQYQAKLRQTTKLLTLEKKIDANLDHVLGYIKTRYGKEYAAWAKPVEVTKSVDPVFSNWLLLSSSEYKSIKEAFEVSGLSNSMNIKEFTKLFNDYYKENNTGKYVKT